MLSEKISLPHKHNEKTLKLLESIPEQVVFDKVAETFILINDSSRIKILWLLCHTEECVSNIAAAVSMSSPAVSHHLRILKQAGLLEYRKDGKEVYYTLSKTDEARMVHRIVDMVFDMKCNI